MNDKKLILSIGKYFMLFLLVITFFSKTIYSMNIAGVALEYPQRGNIQKKVNGEGVVEFAKTKSVFADLSGKATVFVEEGDFVEAGELLFSVEPLEDEDEENKLDSYLLDMERKSLSRQKLETQKKYYEEQLEALFQERDVGMKPFDDDSFVKDLNKIQNDLNEKEAKLADKKKLLDAGLIIKNEVTELENEIRNLYMDYENIEKDREKAREKHEEEYEDAAKKLADEIKSTEQNLKDINLQMEEVTIDEKLIQLEMQEALETKRQRDFVEEYCESSAIVLEIAESLDMNRNISEGQFVLKLGLLEGYTASVLLPKDADYVKEGDTATVEIPSAGSEYIDGIVNKIYIKDGETYADVTFDHIALAGGEKVKVTIQAEWETYNYMLPNSAIRSDVNGHYLLYAEKADTAFGYEVYAKRVEISIERQYEGQTAFYLYANESQLPVIVNSDKPVSAGDRIKIASGSDLLGLR